MATRSRAEIATIDVSLITIETEDEEFGFTTANSINVEPEIEEEAAVRLIIKGALKAQKLGQSILTGNTITLTDNVFNPELVLVLQGGVIEMGSEPGTIQSYTPPASGDVDQGEVFTLNAYSAQYNAAGQIVQYEKISYPNCTGTPVAFGATDGEFRAPEYTITSAADIDQAPYNISYVSALPVLSE